jgi:hypothetical protein
LKWVRFEFGLERSKKWRFFHFTAFRMNFYDMDLDPNVAYARHAMSIDERRKAFQRVPWGKTADEKEKDPQWFVQCWFAGNHSDIGGSYLENESRLSDVSLMWMADAAVSAGIKYDPSVLQLYPDPKGPQHDETRSSIFRYFGKLVRTIPHDAPLHPSVLDRLRADEVLDYDTAKQYRPENLRSHDEAKTFYEDT